MIIHICWIWLKPGGNGRDCLLFFGLWVISRKACAEGLIQEDPGGILRQGRDWGLAHMDIILDLTAHGCPCPGMNFTVTIQRGLFIHCEMKKLMVCVFSIPNWQKGGWFDWGPNHLLNSLEIKNYIPPLSSSMWQVLYSMATIVEDREAGMRIKMKAWFGAGKNLFHPKILDCKGNHLQGDGQCEQHVPLFDAWRLFNFTNRKSKAVFGKFAKPVFL